MSTTQAPIEIATKTIGGILREKHLRLCVPLNQRSYAWEDEHVRDLYGDWASAISEGRDEYFLGSIVVVRVPQSIEVYDGQQRLATSMILVAAIRDWFYRSGDKPTAAIIENDSLFSTHRQTHEVTPHFKLNAEDHEFFRKRVLLRPDDPERKAILKQGASKQSHKKIADAATIAAKHVESLVATLPDSAKGDNLHRWLNFLENGVRVIWVQVGDDTTAFIIFETMNDRGLRLSAADLLKNYLYAKAEDRKNEAVQKWQSMCGVLESIEGEEDGIVDFIRFFWIAEHGPTRSKDLYDSIKRAITNKTKAVAFASQLEATSQDYAAVLTSSHDAWGSYQPSVRKKIETLRSLGVTQVRPVLLAAFRRFHRKELEKLIHACICWSVRCLISGVPSGTLEGHYGRNAQQISAGKIKNVGELTNEMAKIVPDDQRFRAAAATANVANAALARYYLRALQLQADGSKEPQYVPSDESEITLEHILPQKPGAGWEHVTAEEFKANYNRLGNQALLTGTVNSKLGNAEYGVKKPALKASAFSLTRSAAGHEQWGVAQISQRQEKLADLAVLAWPVRAK